MSQWNAQSASTEIGTPAEAGSRFTPERIRRGVTRRMHLARSYVQALFELPARLVRRSRSRRIQQRAFANQRYGQSKKLIVFFIPGISKVTGGGLQIFALHRLTRARFQGSSTDAVICWLPGEAWDLHRFDGFNNDVTVFPLTMVLRDSAPDCDLFFHLPEYAAEKFCAKLGWQQLADLRNTRQLKINIMNQNIEQMPGPQFIERLRQIFPEITATCANPAWMSPAERQRLRIPMHYLPTWYYPDDAPWQSYETKQNLMIVSPDPNPYRERVLGVLRASLPGLTIRVITGMKFEEYSELARKAKWSLTFGEGLDGYFYGPALRGGVPFAVRNGTFDVPGMGDRQTIYENYEAMAERIASDIRSLDTKEAFERYNLALRQPLERLYSRKLTEDALTVFYRGDLDCPVEPVATDSPSKS